MYFDGAHRRVAFAVAGVLLAVLVVVINLPAAPADRPARKLPNHEETVPPLLLAEGRRLEFVRAFSSETEVKTKRSFWSKVVDWVAGPPEYHRMMRPYNLALDSTGRIIITDPGLPGVHIVDFEKNKYELLEGGKGLAFRSPQGVAVDARDNIYVTDSELGIIFIFDAKGKFNRYAGRQKDGKGYFLRPTGIAVDSAANRLYVTDTLRHKVFLLDLDGKIVANFGGRGTAPGQFNYPTEIAARGPELAVVDAMNFRVQMFSRDRVFLRAFGSLGERTGTLLRPKGVAFDSEGNIYLADALLETVQVFNREGQLLYFFGHGGTRLGEFQLPAGLCIDPRNRIYVADSMNQRIQVFQFRGPARTAMRSGQ
jgi:DNA-binding beta-propeller fold protein YncE